MPVIYNHRDTASEEVDQDDTESLHLELEIEHKETFLGRVKNFVFRSQM